MHCDQARTALLDARYASERSTDLDAHLVSCVACSALAAREKALDATLARLPAGAVQPDFDTRFFARLTQEKARGKRRRYRQLAWTLLPLAAGTLLALRPWAAEHSLPKRPNVEVGLVAELEMVRDLDVVSRLDELEAYDLLRDVDDSELARIAQEKP
jgi:hypothetical protein